jgi:hypothetical protein
MAWYQLASLENNALLDIGVTQDLKNYLPKGEILEGEFLLTSAKMRKSFTMIDVELFVTSLREMASEFVYFTEHGNDNDIFDLKNFTYSSFPTPTPNQLEGYCDRAEQYILCFIAICIFSENISGLPRLMALLEKEQVFTVRTEFLYFLLGDTHPEDFNSYMAGLLNIHWRSINQSLVAPPQKVFEIVYKTLQIAHQINQTHIFVKPAFGWLTTKWLFISKNQRSSLRTPDIFEDSINKLISCDEDLSIGSVITLLKTILPTLAFQDSNRINKALDDMGNIDQ